MQFILTGPELSNQNAIYQDHKPTSQIMIYQDPKPANQIMIYQDPKPTNQIMVYQDPNPTDQLMNYQDAKLAIQNLNYQDTKTTNQIMIYQDPKPTNQNIIYEEPQPPLTTNTHPISTASTTSAFNTIPKGFSRQPFTEQPVIGKMEERLPSNVPEMHHGIQPLSGPLNASYLNHIGSRGGVSHFGSGTPGGSDNYMASPTVTMNTRAAQDVVMAMFNNPLGMNHLR